MKKDEQYLNNLRHSTAHLLAAAVTTLWPDAKPTLGPPIEDGFYYDFDFGDSKISEADLPKIEKTMKKILLTWKGFDRKEVGSEKAIKQFSGNEYKKELIDDLQEKGEQITLYKSGQFTDLCRGGHVENPKEELQHFKLLSIAGAYWRGDEKNPMLTRIYGTAFPTQKELDEYLERLEEAKKRDHRKLGKQLGIYMYSDIVGPGLPLYMPKGAIIVTEIEKFMRALQTKMGYEHVYTPHIAKDKLFETSGHLEWFKDSMYPPMHFEGEGDYYAKPMNCPMHIQIYKNDLRSYRDLPIRYAEFGSVYRYEQSGEINGLLRTRGFTQDDAHIFCREDQVVDEFLKVFEFTDTLLKGLGLQKHIHRLSLKGKEKEKYAGNDNQWKKATSLIRQALEKADIKYEEAEGEAAFYGPKLDILFRDSLDREWQISTIQVDFLLPERFDLSYVDENGQQKRPFMIHRAPLGSRERIMAILLEHFAGNFPTWLAPVQAIVLPITDRNLKYAKEVVKRLRNEEVRAELDSRNETLQAKIRDAQLQKIPYMLIIGDKEESAGTVAKRSRSGKDYGQIEVSEFIKNIHDEIDTKKII